MKQPFLIQDIEALRRKIKGFEGIWDRRWQSFQQTARLEKRSFRWYGSDSKDCPLHATLAWLVTQEREFGDISRRDVFWMLDHYQDTLKVGAQDHDTWIYAAPMARRAVAVDWAWELFSPQEQDRIAEHFINDSVRYPFVVLHHRVPSHANNQGLAMALNLVVVGWLFGHKLRQDPRAQHLFSVGIPHLLDQIALLPPGGYGGEGSTYCIFVADPLMALACATLETITGQDFFNRELAPNANCPRKILELSHKLLPPSGVYPGWDQHGFTLMRVGITDCYLAMRTGNPLFCKELLEEDTWELSGHFAWQYDDHVWQLAWMPEPHSLPRLSASNNGDPEKENFSTPWVEPRVCGSITDSQNQLHLFQIWDISGSRPVRAHMNPNSLQLEAFGSLLTVDGNADDHFELNKDPAMQYMHLYSNNPKVISWAPGSIAAHSCIQVDQRKNLTPEDGCYRNLPKSITTGFVNSVASKPGHQMLSVDAVPFYKAIKDMEHCQRSSHLFQDRLWLIHDQIAAKEIHSFTWQLVLRQGAQSTEYGARLETAEHVVLDIFNLDGCRSSLHNIEGYPNTLEGKCHHLRKDREGSRVEFITLLIPQAAREQLADWTEGWSMASDPQDTGLAQEWFKTPELPHSRLSSFIEAYHECPALMAAEGQAVFWFQRQCSLPNGSEEEFLLELPRCSGLKLWIDGQEVTVPPLQLGHQNSIRLQAPFVDIRMACEGKASIDITLRVTLFSNLGICGGVRLHKKVKVPVPSVRQNGENLLNVSYANQSFNIQLSALQVTPRSEPNWSIEGAEPDLESAQLLSRHHSSNPLFASVTARLIASLHDADWSNQLLSIRRLGEMKAVEAVDALLDRLRQEATDIVNRPDYPPKYRIKELCIWALNEIGDSRAAADVASCLNTREFYGIRRLAANALGKLGNSSHLHLLEEWAADPDQETSSAAKRSTHQISLSLKKDLIS